MGRILTPSRRVLRPPYRDFDDLMKHVDDNRLHGIDMECELTLTNKRGKIEGKKSFECHSFVSNFIKLMAVSLKGGIGDEISATDISGEVWTGYNLKSNFDYSNSNWYAKSVLSSGHMPCWTGPIIGTGQTAVSPSDYWLEEPMLHGTLAPPGAASASGSQTSGSKTTLTDSSKAWSTDQWRHYVCKMKTGTASGRRFYIYDNTATQLSFYAISPTPDFRQTTDDRSDNDDYEIWSYGQMTYGDTAFTTPTVDGSNVTLLVTRDFTNGQGSSITVHEFGLQVRYYVKTIADEWAYNDEGDFLIVRDVDGVGVVVQDGEKLSLSYKIITVC